MSTRKVFHYRDGQLVAEETVDVPETPPSAEERIVTLEAELADMRNRVAEVAASNAEVRAMQAAITGGKRP